LSYNRFNVCLYVVGGRFGWRSLAESEPAEKNIFFTIPLQEEALSAFRKSDYKIEIYENVYKDAVPWLRCYQEFDLG
jgi:hypothetical protein